MPVLIVSYRPVTMVCEPDDDQADRSPARQGPLDVSAHFDDSQRHLCPQAHSNNSVPSVTTGTSGGVQTCGTTLSITQTPWRFFSFACGQ